MICPHCKKPIMKTHPEALKKKALQMLSEGYSLRDIESLLERRVNFSTISKWAKAQRIDGGEK